MVQSGWTISIKKGSILLTTAFNDLVPSEEERLVLLAEECSEVVKAVTKILRHGYYSTNPNEAQDLALTNQSKLNEEVGHVLFSIALMISRGDLNAGMIQMCQQNKRGSVNQYLHHNNTDNMSLIKVA